MQHFGNIGHGIINDYCKGSGSFRYLCTTKG